MQRRAVLPDHQIEVKNRVTSCLTSYICQLHAPALLQARTRTRKSNFLFLRYGSFEREGRDHSASTHCLPCANLRCGILQQEANPQQCQITMLTAGGVLVKISTQDELMVKKGWKPTY